MVVGVGTQQRGTGWWGGQITTPRLAPPFPPPSHCSFPFPPPGPFAATNNEAETQARCLSSGGPGNHHYIIRCLWWVGLPVWWRSFVSTIPLESLFPLCSLAESNRVR